MPKLQVIVASTRPGRVGLPIAEWFFDRAGRTAAFDVELVDLAEVNLPMLDEPNHPRLQQYTHEHTKRWSARIASGDAFVFVMPEYNHGFNSALKNAIDYLFFEWQYKPVGFVSYGGIAGGTRAVQMIKPVLVGLKMTPLLEAVVIQFAGRHIEDGAFVSYEEADNNADAMLGELARVQTALAALRQQ